MTKYLIIIEKIEKNYSAYAPDIPGCAATGDTLEEVEKQMKEAILFHFQGMIEDGLPIPKPTTISSYVTIMK